MYIWNKITVSFHVHEINLVIFHPLTQMRKMMSSATMTWLSSCMRVKAAWTSGSVKPAWRPLLISSIRVFIFTDWAWADWNTANSEDLNSFSLVEETSRGPVTFHSALSTSVRKLTQFQACVLADNTDHGKPYIIKYWALAVLTIWSSLNPSPTSLQRAQRLQPVMWHPWPPPHPVVAWLVSGCQLGLKKKKKGA